MYVSRGAECSRVAAVGEYCDQTMSDGQFQLCDTEIELRRGSIVPAHSALLAAHSPTLRKMVEAQSGERPKHIDLSQWNKNAVITAINYIRSGKALIGQRLSIEQVLAVAVFLQMRDLIKSASRMLFSYQNIILDPVTTLNTAHHSRLYVPSDTRLELTKLFAKNIHTVPIEHLLEMRLETVLGMVAADVSLGKKARLVNAALAWLRVSGRDKYTERVLGKMRFRVRPWQRSEDVVDIIRQGMADYQAQPYLHVRIDEHKRVGVHVSDVAPPPIWTDSDLGVQSESEAEAVAPPSISRQPSHHLRNKRAKDIRASGSRWLFESEDDERETGPSK